MKNEELINKIPPDDMLKGIMQIEEKYNVSHKEIKDMWNEIIISPELHYNKNWNLRCGEALLILHGKIRHKYGSINYGNPTS
jgi:hypothetical protein